MEKLFADIQNDTLSHCYLLFGEDVEERRAVLLRAAARISKLPAYVLSDKPKFAEVRQMLSAMSEAQIADGMRVYLIPAADFITEEGQNILLKALEEPSPNVVILMGAASDAGVLTTVKSRAKKLRMPEKPKSLQSEEFFEASNLLVGILKELNTSKDVPRLSAKLPKEKDKMQVIAEVFGLITGELLRGKGDVGLKQKYTMKNLANFADIAADAGRRLSANVSPAAVGENMLFDILEVCYKTR